MWAGCTGESLRVIHLETGKKKKKTSGRGLEERNVSVVTERKLDPGAASPIQTPPVSFKYPTVAMLKKCFSSLVCKQLCSLTVHEK